MAGRFQVLDVYEFGGKFMGVAARDGVLFKNIGNEME